MQAALPAMATKLQPYPPLRASMTYVFALNYKVATMTAMQGELGQAEGPITSTIPLQLPSGG